MSRLHPVLIFILIVLVLASLVVTFSPVNAVTTLPSGFVSESVVTNLTGPTTIAFAPDGRMFIGQKDGRVRVFQNGVLLAADFINISAQVNNYWDRGLMGIAVHPDFPNTPYVYLLYTYDPPGTIDNGDGARVSRLLRVTADPNNTNVALPGSEVVLLGTNSTLANIGDLTSNDGPASCENGGVYVQDCIASDSPSHTVGTLIFGTDGSLFVSSGDGSHFNYTDVRALRALSVDSLNGKVLRIDPITGTGYPDNPFYDGNPNSNRSKVYSLGLRNPFRITINTLTNEPFIGDVGWNAWEEANTGWGRNFGWPCYEGNNVGSAEQGSYKNTAATSSTCSALYSQGLGAVQAPSYSYDHSQGSSLIMGGFYQGTVYPSQYQGGLFFADYDADWIRYLTFDGNGVATKFDFGTDVVPVGGVVQLLSGPDTNLYYVAYNGPTPNTSEIRRIRYTAGGNTPPTANASADPDSGLIPFTVNFSSAGSFDPDVQSLTYAWDFGDGGTSTDPNPSHEYTVAGDYIATLTITDSLLATGSDTVAISAGNLRPVATINAPADGFSYSTNDIINYNGTGIDNEDGNLSGTDLQWDILLHHNQHVHFDFMPGLIGNTGSFSVPDHGDNTWIELCLTVTDSNGLNDQDCVNLQPNTVTLSFDTVPSGLSLQYEGVTYTTPFDVTTNVNSVRDLIAPTTQISPTTQICNTFSSWSDGGSASHQITTGVSPQTYIANYTPCTITASAGSGGTITPSGVVAITTGTSQSFNSVPNAGFILSDVLVDGISVGRANSYTFVNLTSSHTIAANFDGGWSAPTASAVFTGAVTDSNNAFSSNNAYATFDSGTDSVNYTSFGIPAIPDGALINSIQVGIEGYNGQVGGRNAQIQLSWNGGANFTTVTAARTTNLPVVDGTVVLNGADGTGTWGRTWTNTEFTNANFVARVTSTSGGPPAYIDQFQVKVSYIDPSASAPAAAILTSPSGNIGTNYNPTYTWNRVPGSTYYYLWVDGPSGNVIKQWYSSAQANCNGSTCSVASPMLGGGAHTWWVQTWNPVGYGPWSAAMNFSTTTPTAPGATTLSSPSGNIGTNYNPTYTWNQISNSTYYYLWVDGPSGNVIQQWYSSAQANCNGSTCSVTPATTLGGGAHIWKVQTWNSVGYGPFSTVMNFSTTIPTAPGATTLSSPSGNIGTNYNPTYTWNQISNSTYYLLNVSGPSGVVLNQWYTSAQANCNGSTCSVASPTLGGGAHTWKVQTWNSVGYGPFSTVLNFSTTIPTAPAAATLVSPINGTIVGTSTPTYTWNQVSNSTYYYLWVNGPSGNVIKQWYSSAQANCNGSTCSVTPATTLGGGAHTWWVQTWNSVGYGPWSTAANFTR